MHIGLIGINHRTAPLAVRERAAVHTRKLYEALSLLNCYMPHGVILSTCNRTEIYAADKNDLRTDEASLHFLESLLDMPGTDLSQYTYTYRDKAAVEHLFQVASGLDSMTIGEFEILGQISQALDVAERARLVNLPLRHIFHSAVRTGRRVRQETAISKNALSTSSLAVDKAVAAVGDLAKCTMLIVGVGEAGKLVAQAAKERGIQRILVASRTFKRASALATALGGIPIELANIVAELSTCNLIITCADTPHYILNAYQIEEAMTSRNGHPIVIIDIAVPRNVEPSVEQIKDVFLYNIDDLNEIADQNRKQREREVQKVEEIISAEVNEFLSWWHSLEVRPLVTSLMSKAERIRSAQLNRTLKKLPNLSEEELDRLDAMTKSIVTKILKDPIHYLKANQNNGHDIIKDLFQLDVDDS